LFVLPGFGLAGVTGGVLILSGLVMAGQRFTPVDGLSTNDLLNSLLVVVASGGCAFVAMMLVAQHAGTIPGLNRLMLPPPTAALTVPGADGPMTGAAAGAVAFGVQIGDEGIADSPLRPAGRAMFGDDYVDVVSEGLFVDQGDRIRVIRISGNRVMVRKVT
jgi:membrane-bound serine protease (ClpP class)